MQEQVMKIKKIGGSSWRPILRNHICKHLSFPIENPNYKCRLHRLILLVDMKVGLMDSDKMLIDMLTEAHRPFLIVLTKADKLKEKEA